MARRALSVVLEIERRKFRRRRSTVDLSKWRRVSANERGLGHRQCSRATDRVAYSTLRAMAAAMTPQRNVDATALRRRAPTSDDEVAFPWLSAEDALKSSVLGRYILLDGFICARYLGNDGRDVNGDRPCARSPSGVCLALWWSNTRRFAHEAPASILW